MNLLSVGGATLVSMVLISVMSVDCLAAGGNVHKAHTHGAANLTLVFENGVLEIQLEAPAMSLLGFEHEPKNQHQIQTIEKAKALLNSPVKFLSIQGVNCRSRTVAIDVLGPAGAAVLGDDHVHEGPDDTHAEQDYQNEEHSEISATYAFDCGDGAELKSVSVALFEHFSTLEKINVGWITETQQGGVVLSPQSEIVELK